MMRYLAWALSAGLVGFCLSATLLAVGMPWWLWGAFCVGWAAFMSVIAYSMQEEGAK
jgi:hypothetical protein